MNYTTTITKLYFLLIYADGNVNAREISSAKKMILAEGISDAEFNHTLDGLRVKDHEALLEDCIVAIKTLDRNQQIRIIAWLCVLANADGFMDRSEWQLIYRIYHTELRLPLNEIFTVQKELNKLVWLTGETANL
jgi:uncharacterized tellurite resistance protein B-like protein